MNWHTFISRPDLMAAALGAALVAAASAFALWRYRRNRPTLEEMEKRRRLEVNSKGKLLGGEVLDLQGTAVVYTYEIAGVEYTASQDIEGLHHPMPENALDLIGPVGVKFDPRNPANSIVICENWSGLKRSPARRG
jgi:hypothetical protein